MHAKGKRYVFRARIYLNITYNNAHIHIYSFSQFYFITQPKFKRIAIEYQYTSFQQLKKNSRNPPHGEMGRLCHLPIRAHTHTECESAAFFCLYTAQKLNNYRRKCLRRTQEQMIVINLSSYQRKWILFFATRICIVRKSASAEINSFKTGT